VERYAQGLVPSFVSVVDGFVGAVGCCRVCTWVRAPGCFFSQWTNHPGNRDVFKVANLPIGLHPLGISCDLVFFPLAKKFALDLFLCTQGGRMKAEERSCSLCAFLRSVAPLLAHSPFLPLS